MNQKIVLASLAAVTIVALTIPMFVDVIKVERAYARIESVDVKISKVNDSHVTLEFVISMSRSKVLENSSILAKVYDLKTNILLYEVLNKIPEKVKEDKTEEIVPLTLEKDRNYRVLLSIIKGSEALDSRVFKLTGLDSIVPKEKELKVVFKDADFEVREVKDEKAKIFVRFYVEALRSYNVLVHVKAIQYESGLLADEFWKNVSIEGGKTALIEGDLSLPKDYNYFIKLEMWKNDSMLKSWSKALNLAPTKRIPSNVTEKEVKLEISEFVRTPTPISPKPEYAERKAVPGFEILPFILAGGVALWRKRSS